MESSLCQKHQTMPYLHKFINFYLILDGRLGVFLAHTTLWGQLLTGLCGLGPCLWKTNILGESSCKGGGKPHLLLLCQHRSQMHDRNSDPLLVLLTWKCRKTGAGKTFRITQPSLPSQQGIKFTSITLGTLAKAPAKNPCGKLPPVGHCACKSVVFAVWSDTIMKASLSTFVPWSSPHCAAHLTATYLSCSERLPASETSLPSRQNLLEGFSSHTVGKFSL